MRTAPAGEDRPFTRVVVSTQTVPQPPAAELQTPIAEPPGPPLAVFAPLIGFLVLFALATLFEETRGDVPGSVSLAVFAVALAGCALIATVPVTMLLMACAFMDYDGFVSGQHGQLSWHGGSDALRLAVLVSAAVAAAACRRVRARKRTAR